MHIRAQCYILFIIILVLFIFPTAVSAYESRNHHKFFIELPDGSLEELRGIQMYTSWLRNHGDQGWGDTFACYYPIDRTQYLSTGYHCWSKGSCRDTSSISPFFPSHYNSNENIGHLFNDVLYNPSGIGVYRYGGDNICSRKNDTDINSIRASHKHFYNIIFTERFPWFPYEDKNPRGSSEAYWTVSIDWWAWEHGKPFVVGTRKTRDLERGDNCCNPTTITWYGPQDRGPFQQADDIGEIVYDVDSHTGNEKKAHLTWILKLVDSNQPPQITDLSTLPQCTENGTINVKAQDADNDVHLIELEFTEGTTTYTYLFDLVSGYLQDKYSNSPFVVSKKMVPSSAKDVIASITIDNFDYFGNGKYQTVTYRARAMDEEGSWGGWSGQRSFSNEWLNPEIAFGEISHTQQGIMTIPIISNGTSCEWAVSPRESGWEGTIGLLDRDNPTNSEYVELEECTKDYTLSGVKDGIIYNLSARAYGGLCDGSPVATAPNAYEVEIANPWVMTTFGDAYSFLGYSNEMEMLEISNALRNRVGIGYGNLAYFSHYIISKNTGPWFPDRNSLREYLLGDYTDLNRAKVGSTNKVYDYIKEIADSNGCGVEVAALPHNCSTTNVYFLNNSGTTTLPLGWLNQPRNSNRACVIVSNGSIQVPAGASDPDQIDAFFLVDGEFSTALDREILIINGGVIANTVRFNRDLYGNNLNDPAELIRYDPKYLDLLRDCLGENYPYKVREYRYSVPD